MTREAEVERTTGETQIAVSVCLDGGAVEIETGVGFFDHMLEALARHGGLGLRVSAKGDLETGSHHTVEDVGIAIGRAIDEALGDRAGIVRFGSALIPMDDALAECALDLSGRPYAAVRADLPNAVIGGFEVELVAEFVRALATASRSTIHVDLRAGENTHHMVEAIFKSLAVSLRRAAAEDPNSTDIPSTKGTLTG